MVHPHGISVEAECDCAQVTRPMALFRIFQSNNSFGVERGMLHKLLSFLLVGIIADVHGVATVHDSDFLYVGMRRLLHLEWEVFQWLVEVTCLSHSFSKGMRVATCTALK